MASLVSWGANKIKQAVTTVDHAIAPPVNNKSVVPVQAIQNAKYGVLANNPALQQQTIQNAQVRQPNIINRALDVRDSFNSALAQQGQALARTVPEVAGTLADTKDVGKTYTPGNRFTKAAFGITPIQNIQAKVLSTQSRIGAQHGGLAGNLAGLGEGALSIVNDTPVVGLAAKGTRLAIPAARDAATAIAPKLAPKVISAVSKAMTDTSAGLTVGGPKALGYMYAAKHGQTFPGVDGTPRFEIDDSGAKVNKAKIGYQTPLGEVLDHPQLYKQYPDLKNIKVTKTATSDSSFNDDNGNRMTIGTYYKNPKAAVLHEVQHAIQSKEGFAGGGEISFNSPDIQKLAYQHTEAVNKGDQTLAANLRQQIKDKSFSNYQRLGGEAESRAVQARMNMTPAQRATTPFYNSLDVPKNELIINKSAPGTVQGSIEQPNLASIAQADINGRPQAAAQTALEIAHNSGDVAGELQAKAALTDPALRGEQTANKAAGQIFMDAVRSGKPITMEQARAQAAAADPALAGKMLDPTSKAALLAKFQAQAAAHHNADAGYFDPGEIAHDIGQGIKKLAHTITGDGEPAMPKVQSDISREESIYMRNHPQPGAMFALQGKATGMSDSKYLSVLKQFNQTDKIIQTPKVTAKVATKAVTAKAVKTRPTIPKTGTPAKSVGSSPITIPSRFANKTVQNSDKITDQVKSLVKEGNVTYTPQTVKAGQAAAKALAKKNGVTSFATDVTNKIMSSPTGSINRQDVFNAHEVIKRLQATGKGIDAGNAASLLSKLSEHHTAAGQSLQAEAALAARSPEGLQALALKAIANGGKKGSHQDISDELARKIDDATKAIKAQKPGTQAHREAVDDLSNIVNDNVHASLKDKLFTIWRSGLLSGPQTVSKVVVSHLLQNVLEKAKDLPAVALDKTLGAGISKALNGKAQLSTSLTPRGLGDASVGFKAGLHLLRTGHDTTGTGGFGDTAVGMLAHSNVSYHGSELDKLTHGVSGSVLNAYTRKIGQVHASIPKAYFTSAQSNDLFKQAIAAGKTAGLSGDKLGKFVQDFVKKPTETAQNEARLAGQHATFQQPTKLGEIAKAYQKAPGGRVLAPFAHIASAILTDAADYSPVGTGKAIFQAVKDNGATGWTPTVQKHFVEELGRSIVGTGAVAMGYQLYKHGLMTLNYPTSPKEQALWTAEKKQENAILLNGKWRSTGSLGPIGTVLAAGGFVGQGGEGKIKKGKVASTVADALEGAAENLTSQSFLSGATDFSKALANPAQNLSSYAKQQAASGIPILVQTLAKATDPNQRQVGNVAQAIQSKIPGLREHLPAQTTPFGATNKRDGSVLANIIDPTRPTTATNDPVTNELARLDKTTGSTDNAIPQTLKSVTGKDGTDTSQTVALNKAQEAQLSTAAGPKIHSQMSQIMNDPRYKGLSDDEKNTILSYVTTDQSAIAKANLADTLDGGLSSKLTTDQKSIVAGQPIDYFTKLNSSSAAKASTGSGTTAASYYKAPDAEYKAAQAAYNTKVQNNSFGSQAAKITATESLKKAQVGSSYDKSVRDAYNLSNADLYNYVSTDPNGAAIAKQVLDYGDALTAAGITSKNKFRDKYGNVTLDSGTSTASSTKTTTTKSTSAVKKLVIPKQLKVKVANFKLKTPKLAKSKRLTIPKYAIKTPKVTHKAVIA